MTEPHYSTTFHEAPIVVIDFETTGLDSSAKAVEVALVRFEKGESVRHYGSLINPGIQIPLGASKIHGITDADVKDSMDIVEFFQSALTKELLDGAQLCAYNAPYDRRFVPWQHATVMDERHRWIDPLLWAREHGRGVGKNSLVAACERYGVKLTGAHRAYHDALATGTLMYVLADALSRRHSTVGSILERMYPTSQPPKITVVVPRAIERKVESVISPTGEPKGATRLVALQFFRRLEANELSLPVAKAAAKAAIDTLGALPILEAKGACWDAYVAHRKAMDDTVKKMTIVEMNMAVQRLKKLMDSSGPDTDEMLCIHCHEPQFMSPGGITCRNGHGGAESI